MEKAIFAGGCFWCTEAIFQGLKGVSSVMPGYSGGKVVNPTYEQVCDGNTGHAEATEIQFDPAVIPYSVLVEVFFATHDPTTMNRQGNDVGPQYRSVVFYTTSQQKEDAEKYVKEAAQDFSAPIVTTIEPLEKFYVAENYHQNYFKNNERQPYCQAVINPKLKKFREKFANLLK
jgi:peptide-methionine (S)-S-oxide reductase